MTSLLCECEHERDELYARVRKLERERDEARAINYRGLMRLAENARLREALRETLEVVEGETCGECGVECEACECDGSAWWRRARAALAGEECPRCRGTGEQPPCPACGLAGEEVK